MSCAKTAEPIKMPFGLWTRVSLRKHALDGAQIRCEGAIIREKDVPGHARRHSAVSCAKMAEPIDLLFGLWTPVSRFTRWRQYALMAQPGLMSNYFNHLFCSDYRDNVL